MTDPQAPAGQAPVPRAAAEKARGDVHHLVNPAIGLLRSRAHRGEPLTEQDFTWIVRRLEAATDIVDALVGAGPTREQLAETYRDLGLGR